MEPEINFMDLIAETPRPLTRVFYRCGLCLGSFAVDGGSVGGNMRGSRCDCGGELSYMGRVQRDRLVMDQIGTPCDHRCTNATGPLCDCRCGGANHGSQRIVMIQVDKVGVPRIVSGTPDQAKRFKRKLEFQVALSSAESALTSLPEDHGSYWAPGPRRKLNNAIRKAQASKAHHHRINLLAKAIAVSRCEGAL